MSKERIKPKIHVERLKCLSGLSDHFQRNSSMTVCSKDKSGSINNGQISNGSNKTLNKEDSKTNLDDEFPCICVCADKGSIGSKAEQPKEPDRSMLITGFGIRNHESLQRALLDDEQRRAMLLHQYKDTSEECMTIIKSNSTSSYHSSKFSTDESLQASTDVASGKMLPLEYLMGLSTAPAEEAPELKLPSQVEMAVEDEERPRTTLAMRQAQKYLRSHRIFEFFQFLTAHLLSALPDDPINFLLDLLDKCLIYRTGLGFPPLLYDKPHLEQLFYLMDRMRTGFIELEQYKTGMKTLGICSYEKSPPLTSCGMVAKDVFIEEAYDCLTDIFQDMIRRRGSKSTSTPSLITPPPTEVTQSRVSTSVEGQ